MKDLELIPGTPYTLGRRRLIMPALNIKALRGLRTELDLVQKGIDVSDAASQETYLKALIAVTHTALVRNYPDISEAEVEDGIDLGNLKDTVLAVMGASGFRVVDDEQPAAAGPAATTGE